MRSKPSDLDWSPSECEHTLLAEVHSEAGKKIGYACAFCRRPVRAVGEGQPKTKPAKREQMLLPIFGLDKK